MFVEDRPDNRWVAEDILVRNGHKVTSCESGAVALILCHEQGRQFDVILLNARMPLMDGAETARRLREHPVTNNVPIVGVSALEPIPDADVNVFKPCSRREFLQAIAQTLVMRRGGRPETIQESDTKVTLLG